MNHCGIQQNGSFTQVVCPKPRRLNLFNTTMNEPVRPLRWQMCSYQQELCDSKSGPELLDLILAKGGGYGGSEQTYTPVASSPPFFCGSPPTRVSNPLIQDARFGDEKITPISPRSMIPNPDYSIQSSSPSSSSSTTTRKGACNRPNYGGKPAVRIEGFDCLDRDNRRNCSIPALAWLNRILFKKYIQKEIKIKKTQKSKNLNLVSWYLIFTFLAFWRRILHILKKRYKTL